MQCNAIQCNAMLYCTLLHCTALQYPALHYIGGFCNALIYVALHCTVLHFGALHFTALHSTELHWSLLHCTALHNLELHCTVLHCPALHCSMNEGGSSLFLRDEVFAQDGINSWLPMSHRLIDRMHFERFCRSPTLRKVKKFIWNRFFLLFSKLVIFKTNKNASDYPVGVT